MTETIITLNIWQLILVLVLAPIAIDLGKWIAKKIL